MLSRVANTFYWMVRYVERADNLARLIDVNQQLLMDFERLDSERLKGFWYPIILSAGDDEAFNALYSEAGSAEVIHFLTDDLNNPNSIRSCIAQARENARTVRDQLSDELWEEINSLYLFLRSDAARDLLASDAARFYQNVRRSAETFLGIAASTILRNEAWEFMNLGRYLERADKTTRFLDVTSYLGGEDGVSGAPGVLHWSAILRSCGALGSFRSVKREISAREVFEFLVFSKDFPRSVLFCMEAVDAALHRISGSQRGAFVNEAERLSGRLLADLTYGSPDEALAMGLHAYLDSLQLRFNDLGEAIFESFVLMPERFEVPTGLHSGSTSAISAWQMQQMQQQ